MTPCGNGSKSIRRPTPVHIAKGPRAVPPHQGECHRRTHAEIPAACKLRTYRPKRPGAMCGAGKAEVGVYLPVQPEDLSSDPDLGLSALFSSFRACRHDTAALTPLLLSSIFTDRVQVITEPFSVLSARILDLFNNWIRFHPRPYCPVRSH